jgi:demethylmenaquinone methyltransferase/2-methoxy-6-polyprenyl-1,4-benzoquinol methylase
VDPNYEEEYLSRLFDRMGPTYDFVNVISSFGFCNIWRRRCVKNASLEKGAIVADLMAGSGECWRYVTRVIGPTGRIISVDFSPVMCERQGRRVKRSSNTAIEVRRENALAMSLPDSSIDVVVSAFGLKTFNPPQWTALAHEVHRILRPGGQFSFLEISLPDPGLFRTLYLAYIGTIIPFVGRLFLGEIDCYRMLGVYTLAFGDCRRVIGPFADAGLEVHLQNHFFGCATSIKGMKPMNP